MSRFLVIRNARPQWLTDAHATLYAAMVAAYGRDADIANDVALGELLEFNLAQGR